MANGTPFGLLGSIFAQQQQQNQSGQSPTGVPTDILEQLQSQNLFPPGRSPRGTFEDVGKLLATQLGTFGALATPVGLGNLLSILQSQGRTDPRLFNRQLTSIAQGTAQSQLGAQEALARGGPGLQQSGVGQALQAAIGQAGQDRQAALRAQEAREAEARRRQDLGLLLSLLIGPSLRAGQTGITGEIALEQGEQGELASILGAALQGAGVGLGGAFSGG